MKWLQQSNGRKAGTLQRDNNQRSGLPETERGSTRATAPRLQQRQRRTVESACCCGPRLRCTTLKASSRAFVDVAMGTKPGRSSQNPQAAIRCQHGFLLDEVCRSDTLQTEQEVALSATPKTVPADGAEHLSGRTAIAVGDSQDAFGVAMTKQIAKHAHRQTVRGRAASRSPSASNACSRRKTSVCPSTSPLYQTL